jgi:hypothetical protein
MVRVVFSKSQLCCLSAASLFRQLLPQHGGFIQFWMLPSVPEISTGIHSCPVLGGWSVIPTLLLAFVLVLISAECWFLLWEVSLFLHSFSQPLCFSWSRLGASTFSGGWLVGLSPALSLSCFMHMLPHLWEFSTESSALCPTPFFWARSAFHPHLWCWCNIIVRWLWFSVLLGVGVVVRSAQGLCCIIFPGVGWGRMVEGSHTWGVMLTCSFCRSTQAALEPADGEKCYCCFHCSKA